jgi:hypothetical protein
MRFWRDAFVKFVRATMLAELYTSTHRVTKSLPPPLRKQMRLIERKIAVLDGHPDQSGGHGFGHRPTQQSGRSGEALAVGSATMRPL